MNGFASTPMDAWNHFFLTVSLFTAWTVALAYMGGHQILWQYDQHPDETQQH